MSQSAALLLSYVFIFGVLGITQILLKTGIVSASVSRKLVHIGVAHWWLFAMLWMPSIRIALIGPVSFIGLNYLSYRVHLFKSMEREKPRKNLGTVYFPIALTALVALTWAGPFPKWYGLAAILVLGWGDGMASLVGECAGRRPGVQRLNVPGGSKTIAGTTAMFLASGAVATLLVWLFSGPLAAGPVPAPAEAGFGLWDQVVTTLKSLGSRTWVGEPTDSTVLFALSRFNGIVRAVSGLAVGSLGAGMLETTWHFAPSEVLATALIIAAAASAVELLTPWGLDNLTVPFVVFVVLGMVLPLPGEWIVRLAWAVGLNMAVASAAYLKRTVTATGAVAGAGVGFVIYLAGGIFFWSVLMAFFIGSSALSRIKSRLKSNADRINTKGSRRDAVQVLANGGLAAAAALLHGLTGRPIFLLGFGIALAAANADTWASEIGVLSRHRPVGVLSWKPVPRGTSGGVSALGFLASAAGALFIALWLAAGYWITSGWNGFELGAIVAAITGGGVVGSLVDSVLGATVQAKYWDETGKIHTERRHAESGRPNRLVRGFHFFTNDLVNAVSGVVSVVTVVILVA